MRTDTSGICLHRGEKTVENGECRRILTDSDWIGNDRRCEEGSNGEGFQDGELHVGGNLRVLIGGNGKLG